MELTDKLAKQLKALFGHDVAFCVERLLNAEVISTAEARRILFA